MKDFPPANATLLKGDNVPAPSEDLAGADREIKRRVTEFVEELVRKQQTTHQ